MQGPGEFGGELARLNSWSHTARSWVCMTNNLTLSFLHLIMACGVLKGQSQEIFDLLGFSSKYVSIELGILDQYQFF